MNDQHDQKVTVGHRSRDAYLYVRYAIPRQGLANARTIQRHDQLWRQAVALGWPTERVIVIDSDMSQSGVSPASRAGFQMLVRHIELGRVGLVMALEPSRLTRSVEDWDRLLKRARSTTRSCWTKRTL